jgi:type II secretory pathway component GspD/PulD (secretin)/tetratricopeptide (TPR) repeat protein
MLTAVPASKAQTPPQETAVNEAVYRQANRITLRQKLADAQAAQERRALPTAAKLYDEAWELVQSIGSGVDAERDQAIAGLAAVRLELARAAQRKGDYREARTQVDDVLRVDPANAAAVEFKAGNEKLLAEQRGAIPSEEVRSQVPAILEEKAKASTLVHDGKLLYEMNKLNEADAKLKLALKEDPHNEAALYYLNLVSEAKFAQAAKAHEVTMRQDIRAVEQAWANPVSREMLPVPNPYARTNLIHTGQGREAIMIKLDRIRFDNVRYDGLPLGEVILGLSEESRKRDPEKRGVNFIVSQNVDSGGAAAAATSQLGPDGNPLPPAPAEQVDMSAIAIKIVPALTDIRLADVLDAIVKVADRPIKYSIEDYAIVFSLKGRETVPLYVRTFKVDANTFEQGLQGVGALIFGQSQNVGQNTGGSSFGGGGGGGTTAGQSQNTVSGAIIAHVTVAGGPVQGGTGQGGGIQQQGTSGAGGLNYLTKTNNMENVSLATIRYFQSLGVDLDPVRNPGKALFFNDRQGLLVVRATMQDLDLIEAAIQVLNVVPPEVNIKAKFIEISQDDTKALGFDWYLGNVSMAGGAIGGQGGSAPSFYGAPTAANPIGIFPGTPFATTPTTIAPTATDQLLTSGLHSVGSPVFTLTGILTDPQFRVVINALQQRSGAELLAAPEVTTTSGRQAQMKATDIESIVTAFSFSQAVAGGTAVNGTTTSGAVGTAFVYPLPEQMEIGPVLDALPVVLSDGFTINLTLIPTVTAFTGYDDTSTLLSSLGTQLSALGTVTLIPTVLPHFTVRQVISSVNVWDGQTVVLGGLLSENVQTIKDQIPMLGDIPLLGRLFRSESKTTAKANLLIFVTPLLIDPAGNRLHAEEEMPFAQTGIPVQPPAANGAEKN